MGESQTQAQARGGVDGEACAPGTSVADVLRLLSGGASGAIVMALGRGPLRTMNLTQVVRGYTPRTIYRYAGKLAELEVVERHEEPGVPSKVVHKLTHPCGSDLYQLLDDFADASMSRLPSGEINAHAWASMGLLADLWESGMVEELSCDPRSPTELARGRHDWSFHQVNRRANLFRIGGLVSVTPGVGRRTLYALTDKTREAMALIAGIGRWRHRHVIPESEEGLAATEVATILRTALPLVRVPSQVGKCIRLEVLGSGSDAAAEGEMVWAEVEADGRLHSCASPAPSVDGWGRAEIGGWLAAILDNRSDQVDRGGDETLIDACLTSLYAALWAKDAARG
jgi:DNA-binding HxlR family transcriptional regulator